MENQDQVFCMSIMVIKGKKCLLTDCDPLQLMLRAPVERKNVDALQTTLQSQLGMLRERGVMPPIVHMEPRLLF